VQPTSKSPAFAPSLTAAPSGVYAVWTEEVASAPWQVWGNGVPSSTYSGLSVGAGNVARKLTIG
jgi:hypothetical protein